MRAFALAQTFALITLPFRPFQHLVMVKDQMSCLTCVRRHLADDGRFIFDLFNPSLEILANTALGTEIETDPPFEMEHLLARMGFAVEHVYADFDRTPFGSKYPGELIFVAHKTA